jgi:tRNA modification GTPase
MGGVVCRFIDTAGLRAHTTDTIEAIGIVKAREKMQQAALILYVFDLTEESLASIQNTLEELMALNIPFIKVGNKIDIASADLVESLAQLDFVLIAAAQQHHIEQLEKRIIQLFQLDQITAADTIVVHARHHESLVKGRGALLDVLQGLSQYVSSELLMLDIKRALNYLGEITGEITTEHLLDELFSKFCIGK